DPVREGLVESLNRPGGNATGVTIFGPAAVTKRLQLLHDLVPNHAVTAFLMNPNNPNGSIEMGAVQTAATSLGRQIFVVNASSESGLDAAFAQMVQQRIGALLGASDPFLFNRRDQIVSLAARHGIPAIYYLRDFAHAGGSDGIRQQPYGHVPPSGRLCGADPQRGETNQFACGAVDQI